MTPGAQEHIQLKVLRNSPAVDLLEHPLKEINCRIAIMSIAVI